MKIEEGTNPRKVGSLLGDKPISSFFETLWYGVGSFPWKRFFVSAKEEESVKALSVAKRENTLEGSKAQESTGCTIRVIPGGV